MNIQKVGVLLAMAAVFSASKAKSETTSPDTMRDVFQKPVISAVSTGDLVYTLRPDAEIRVPVTNTETNEHGFVKTETIIETQKYPIQVQSEGTGFAFNFNKDGKCPDFSSMAYNENSDTLFLGLNGKTNICYTLDKASTENKLAKKTLSEKNLMDASETSHTFIDTPLYMISYDNKLLTFSKNSKIMMRSFTINGNLKAGETVSSGLFQPKFDCQTSDFIYVSDGTQTIRIDKNNCKTIETVEQPTQNITSMTSVDDKVIFSSGSIIYGSKLGIQLSNVNEIHAMTTDGETAFIAVDKDKTLSSYTSKINDNIPAVIVSGVKKVIPYNKGLVGIKKDNTLVFLHNNQYTR